MVDFTTFLNVPVSLAKVELFVTKPLTFKHFYHGNVIRALLINLLKKEERVGDHGLSPGIVPVILQNGYLNFKEGDTYTFGLIFIGGDLHFAEKFKGRLTGYVSKPQGILQLGLNTVLKDYTLFDEINLLNIFMRIKQHLTEQFTIRLLTPLAIDREKDDIVKGHTRYDQQLFRIDVFFRKIIDRFNNLCQSGALFLDKIKKDELPPVSLTLQKSKLLWLELPTRQHKNNYGGVIGQLQVEGRLDDFWLMALIAGSIMHIGEKVNFGFGYYDLPNLFTEITQLLKPQVSLMDLALDENHLFEAFQQTLQSSPMSGVDDVTAMELEEQYDFWQISVREKVLKHEYQPAPLKGIVSKINNKIRALAVPSIIDRWLQRAAINVLAPTLDTLFEDCSFAYRRNYSRQQAQAAIRQAYKEGYQYVLESDIENFFDEVEWEILIGKLRAIFPFEPLIDLIEQWTKAPVMFKGKLIERKKGLPQGAVISPLLSNLYLDEFDEQITMAGFKLIRFADDFVILCKSKKQAENALQKARQALEQLDLELKESKTKITHFDEGFRYLGYLFCRSVVLETIKMKDARPFDWALLDESKIPPNSWLAEARFNGLTLDQFVKEKRNQLFNSLFPKKADTLITTTSYKKTVYLGQYQIKLRVKHHQLQVIDKEQSGQILEKIPLSTIQQLVLLGPVPLSMPVIFKLIRFKIPILLANRQSKPLAVIQPFPEELTLWLEQEKKFNEETFRMTFSRSVVLAKINNFQQNLRFLNWPEKEQAISELITLKNSCLNKNSIDSIRGVEGRAAAVFYEHFGKLIGPMWNFRHRQKHPPADAINALLSLGYTILYNYLTTMIIAHGLNPQKGIYHVSKKGFNALSSDLQEEFRFLIDRLILTLINRKQIKPNQFKQPEKTGTYYILPKTIKKFFIRQVEQKLNQQIRWKLTEKNMSYLEIMAYQVNQLKQIIGGNQFDYKPFLRR